MRENNPQNLKKLIQEGNSEGEGAENEDNNSDSNEEGEKLQHESNV